MASRFSKLFTRKSSYKNKTRNNFIFVGGYRSSLYPLLFLLILIFIYIFIKYKSKK
jgi:hypothetical protein